MNWNKWNRWIHRELGYLFFGMSIIYGVSGIALNHFVARHWDPGIISRSEKFHYPESIDRGEAGRDLVEEILAMTGQEKNFKQYFLPSPGHMMIYLRGGHIDVELATGSITLTRVRSRPFFSELNYLHYNKPKKLWTWFSDLYAAGLVILAVTGLFLVKGKKGLRGRGGLLTLAGILIPFIFLVIYLWL